MENDDMPYIKSEDYVRAVEAPTVPGELNYAITMKIVARLRGVLTYQEFDRSLRNLTLGYLDRTGMSYTNGNAVMGVLDCAARELRRRNVSMVHQQFINKIERQLKLERHWVYDKLLAPYEDVKIAENGDVYPKALLSGS
jgi:hypothetical protein